VETIEHDPATDDGLVLGRYALLEELGSGGFGAVWLARDERLERHVAVKRIPVSGPDAAARAEKEALAAARLSHPAVVSLYEAGRDDRAVYLVSELVRGRTLAALLAEGALSDRDVALAGMALCDALAHAHGRGVIHRDVKPGNVLVPEGGADGAHPVAAKLTDFGIARIAGDDALTVTGDVVGTLAYMAPEQAEGRGATAASDVYSLGLVLYEAFGGVNPVRGANAAATARNVGMRLPSLRRLRPDLPRGLCAALDASVQPDPALRGSPGALRLALAGALREVGDEPGTVAAPAWAVQPTHSVGPIAQHRRRARRVRQDDPAWAVQPTHSVGPMAHGWRGPVGIPGRAASALLTAAAIAAALSLPAAPPPLDPAAAAALGAAATALAPRLGWLACAAVLAGWLATRPGDAWWVIALAAAPLPLLLPHRPAWWSAPGLAVVLGWIGAALAWPALAGQARGPYTRAVLGAAGFWTLSLVALLLDRRLLLDPAESLTALARDPALAAAGVWALAAAALPHLVRGRHAGADLLAAVAWAAALAAGTVAAAGAQPRGLVGAAALAALLAVLAGALRRRETP